MKYQEIQYNLLNLPSRITYSDGRMADYVYSATGTKLSVTYTNGGSIKNNQYCGNMLYENGTLKQILIDGGYITFNGSAPQYHFYLKDHLGNNRVVVNASGTVEQVNHYYPFGGLMGESTNGDIQRYKYNGKELDRMNGLDWYDYGARYMDGIRFTTIDPLCEKDYATSPYVCCKDNPVRYVDPDGRSIYMLFYTSGNNRGDEMFRSAAETRKYEIEHSDYFDNNKDIVILGSIQDLSDIGQFVKNIIDSYSGSFGKTAEFSFWSHASLDGPTGTIPTSSNAIDKNQMSIEGWGNINFNWGKDATANFYGCRTGVSDGKKASFVTRISAQSNFRDVTISGQTSYAYPSIYTNVRQNTHDMIYGKFNYPVYMVGGGSLGIIGKFFPTFSSASPMRRSINGKGVVNNYYQSGRKY